jgi:DNA-binding CsgD family transcriptional regulator
MLLERDREIAQLNGLLDGVADTGSRLVLVRGEAGIGKSALIDAFIAGVDERAHVLTGSCDDLLTPQTFGPLWDIARDETVLLGPLESDYRRGVMEALLDLMTRALRPTVLTLEDTQWADEATLDTIRFLGRRIGDLHGLIVLTYRDSDVDPDHPLRQILGEMPADSIARLRLEPLSADSIAELVGDDLDVTEILAVTGGNPLFVSEVAAHGLDGIPESIQDAVLARAARLSRDAREVLDVVAVSPGGLEVPVVEKLLGHADEALSEAERSGLVRVSENTVGFVHELQRRAVEAALGGSDRRRLNNHVLFELADTASSARLAHHAREAGDADAIVMHGLAAARAALDLESHNEAVSHFRSLEPHLDRIPEGDRARFFEDWARSEFLADKPVSVDLLDRAIELRRQNEDPVALARTLVFSVRLNEINGRPETAQANADEAVDLLKDGDPGPDLAFAMGQQAWLRLMRHEDPEAVEELARSAMELAESVDDDRSYVYALNSLGFIKAVSGDPDGFTMLEECRSRAADAGLRFEEVRASINLAGAAQEQCDVERMARWAMEAREAGARYEVTPLEAFAGAILAQAHLWAGRWAEAEDEVEQIAGSHTHVELHVAGQLGIMLARKGGDDAAEHISQAWKWALKSSEPQNLVPAATVAAELLWLTGQGPATTDDLLEILDVGLRSRMSWLAGMLAGWLWRLGALDVMPVGVAEPYHLLAHGDATAAAAIWRAKGIPYEEALALMHGTNDDRLSALRILESLGATAVAARVRAQLKAAGVQVGRGKAKATRENVAGLTARQAEVLDLLAEDLSNPDIADRLFLSPRTVENHVAAVLLKLGAANRTEAVELARERGLLSS